jgi:ferritin-like metal-binding protein YciE
MTENLKDLFEDELKDMYNAEQQILKALPKLIKAARSDELREALENHLDETQGHKERLEKIFSTLGLPAKGKTCDGIKGILAEGDDMVGEAGDNVIDACIAAAAQKVEHYEWSSYGTLKTWAVLLGHDDIATLLEQSETEEKAADAKLTEIAESFANDEAMTGERHEEEEEATATRSRGGEEEGEEDEDEGSPARGRSRSTAGVKSTTEASRRRDRAEKPTRSSR